MAILNYLARKPPENIKSALFRSGRGEYPLRLNPLAKYFIYLNNKCNFGRNGRLIFSCSHSLRKYFATKLHGAGLSQLVIDWLLGHRIDKTTEAYFKADPEKLLKSYKRVVEELSIEMVKFKTVSTEEYDQLLKELREKDEDYKNLERRMELMEKLMDDKEFNKDYNI